MGCIIKRKKADGSVFYLAQARRNGETYSKTFKYRREAANWLKVEEASPPPIEKAFVVNVPVEPVITVAECIERYIVEIIPGKKAQTDQIRQLRYWKESIGTRDIKTLTPADMAAEKSKLLAMKVRGKQRAKPTINRYLAVFSHVLTIAMKEWFITTDNPMLKIRRFKENAGRVRVLTDAERHRLLEAVKEGPRHLEPVVLLALYTGMRKGEIRAIKWQDVNLADSLIILPTSKNGDPRRIPLVPIVVDTLRQWARGKRRNPEQLVFQGKRKGHPYQFDHSWDGARKRAQLPDLHFHDLRHCTASYLAMSGASSQEIAEVLGHKTLEMVKRYSHFMESHTRTVLNRMADKFSLKKNPGETASANQGEPEP